MLKAGSRFRLKVIFRDRSYERNPIPERVVEKGIEGREERGGDG